MAGGGTAHSRAHIPCAPGAGDHTQAAHPQLRPEGWHASELQQTRSSDDSALTMPLLMRASAYAILL